MKKCKKNIFGLEMKNLQDTKKGGITSAFPVICKPLIKRTLQQLLRKAPADLKSASAR